MRRTLALVLAVPAAIGLLAPSPPAPAAPDVAPMTDTEEITATPAPGDSPATTIGDGGSDLSRVPDAGDGVLDGAMAGDALVATDTGDGGGAADPAIAGAQGPAVEATFVVAPVPAAGGLAGSGPRWRYTVEVDPSLGIDPVQVATEVRAALHDPRSWARDRTMEQVADPSRARIRVVLAPPSVVDALCGQVGLDTAGIYSCWTGRFALLNAWRWDTGAEGFPDLATYRTYLVNHEVGHGLGFGHEDCPGPEAVAPVMMQQSKGLEGCVANGWPYP